MPVSRRAVSVALRGIALGSIALFASVAAKADDVDPRDLLRRMSAALRTVDFEGSFIYQHEGRTDALRIFHAGGARERERLVSLNGARGEIVRDGATITCVQPGAVPTLFANRAGMRLLPLAPELGQVGAQYRVVLAGDDRIAGYDARILDIEPRDPWRYGYRLWLQRDNQLLLRSAVVDASRRPLAQSAMSQPSHRSAHAPLGRTTKRDRGAAAPRSSPHWRTRSERHQQREGPLGRRRREGDRSRAPQQA